MGSIASPSRWLLLGACLLALPGLVQAQWKWRDARGQVQYSDLPPPRGTPQQDILQTPRESPVAKMAAPANAASGPLPAAAPAAADPGLEAKRKQAEQAEAAKRKVEEERVAQQRAQACERAGSYLRTLESGQRLARVNARGEREIIDDSMRQAEMAQAREAMASECR